MSLELYPQSEKLRIRYFNASNRKDIFEGGIVKLSLGRIGFGAILMTHIAPV